MRQNAAHSMMTAAPSMPAGEARTALSSASMPTKGDAVSCGGSGQVARSNIQAGTSSHRSAAEPFNVQRKTTPSALSTASWIATRNPNHGCQR